MTAPVLKIRVLQRPTIKGKMDVRYPARVDGDKFISVTKANGIITVDVDYTLLGNAPLVDPTTAIVAFLDQTDGIYKATNFQALLAAAASVEQHITGAGPVTVLQNTSLVRVDQTVGAPITLNLVSSNLKNGAVKIVDWKGDAGTNNITINTTGTDKLQGNRTSWTIASDLASVVLTPISGIGYVV